MTDTPETDNKPYDMRPGDKTETRTFTLPLNKSGGSYVDDVWFAWTATYIDSAEVGSMVTVSNILSYRSDAKILNLSAEDLPDGVTILDLVATEQWRNHLASEPDTPPNAHLVTNTIIPLNDFFMIPKGLPVKHYSADGVITHCDPVGDTTISGVE